MSVLGHFPLLFVQDDLTGRDADHQYGLVGVPGEVIPPQGKA